MAQAFNKKVMTAMLGVWGFKEKRSSAGVPSAMNQFETLSWVTISDSSKLFTKKWLCLFCLVHCKKHFLQVSEVGFEEDTISVFLPCMCCLSLSLSLLFVKFTSNFLMKTVSK